MAQVNKEVIDEAYSFTIEIQGEVIALVPGNMGFFAYEPTGIKLNCESLAIWKLGREALKKKARTQS